MITLSNTLQILSFRRFNFLIIILIFTTNIADSQTVFEPSFECNAGAWLFYKKDRDIYLLLAGHTKQDLHRGWSTFGGRCDTTRAETPQQAAAREVYEETSAYFGERELLNLFKYQKGIEYNGFHTFFVQVEPTEAKEIQYNLAPQGEVFRERKPYAWVKLKDLYQIVKQSSDGKSADISNLDGIEKSNSKMYLYQPFFLFLKNNQSEINSIIDNYDKRPLKGKLTSIREQSGKSTDRVFYHYLFDISGSTKPNDPNLNLKKLLNSTWAIKKSKDIWPIGFHSYSFGTSRNDSHINTYDLNKGEESLRDKKDDIVSDLNSRIQDRDSVDQYTHVLTALNSIKEPTNFTSDGLFIITDGQLKEKDVDDNHYDYDQYLKDVDLKIRDHKKRRPVFIIQSSLKIENDFYPILMKDTIKTVPKKAAMGVDYFWVNSNVNAVEDAEVMALFGEFLQYAHFQITNQDTYLTQETVIAKLLVLSKVFALGRDTQDHDRFMNLMRQKLGFNHSLKSTYYASLNSTPGTNTWRVSDELADLDLLFELISKDKLEGSDLSNAVELLEDYINDDALYTKLIRNYQSLAENEDQITGYHQELKNALISPKSTDIENVDTKDIDRDLEESIILGLKDYLVGRTKQEALFVFYDRVYSNVMKPSTFIRDTLFYHFSRVIEPTNGNFDPNVLLLKEALNRDINLLPENLTKHPHAKNSEALQALSYTYHLIKELDEAEDIETAFTRLIEVTSNNGATTSIEKGLLFASQLIAFLKDHDLNNVIDELSDDEFDNISRLVTIWFISENPDITNLNNLNQLQEKVRSVYSKYGQLKKNIVSLTKELESLTGSNQNISDLNEYKLELMLSVFRQSTDIMFVGLEILEHFPDVNDFSSVKKQVYEYKMIANTAADVWLELHRKNYAKAASLIIPLLPEDVPINLASDILSELEEYKSGKNDIEEIIKQKVLVNKDLIGLHFKQLDEFGDSELGNLLFKAAKLDATKLDQFLSSKNISFIEQHIPKVIVHLFISDLTGNDLANAKAEKDELEVLLPLLLKIEDDAERDKKIEELGKAYLTSSTFSFILNQSNYRNYATELKKAYTTFKGIAFVKRGSSRRISKIADKLDIVLKDLDPMYQDLLIQYFDFLFLNDDLKKLIAIAGEVSNASNAEDVKNVMESYALPVASYRLKRKESFTFMINAYTGLGGSYFFDEIDKGSELDFILSAPIGLETSFRTLKPFKSISLFFPIIDVGNIINYRANNLEESNTDSDRDIRLEKVFSPGVHLVFGLSKKHPFTFNLGYQANPGRLLATLNFDLPLFRIR